ncbi:hypothetical protein J3R82DRAFT_7512 [Butyriboletus roseoflavus]|nr:hypothetical protein J3R82DRAFT_7512 [Butyriboletus roseoflavus]
MSTTPTANITSKSSPHPQTPSRRLEYDSQVPHSQSTTQAHTPSHLTADLTSSHNPAQGPSHHSRPEEDVNTKRPTKRQRTSRLAHMATERASSSSDSSSQSGMADNETEAERSQQSERSAPQTTAPPKKKRTRTLTTPHQSAVLHALLAKSRFPTTAMREEVGRQIGLSARKVQIWFQNQRQKARRPQGEPASLTRPPQFGPFPIMTPAGPSSSSYPYPTRSGVHASKGSLDSDPGLSGPGIPGWSSSSHQRGPPSAEEWEPPLRAPTSPEITLGSPKPPLPPRLSEGIPARDSRGSTHGPALQPAQATHVETSPHFSRVLPPISLSALEPRSSTEPYVSATPSFPPQPPSRTSLNIIQRHDSSARPAIEPGSPVRLTRSIPPPFALQPQPQWDPQTFAPYTRPEFASWSQTSGSSMSSARTSFSAAGAHDRLTRNMSPDPSHGRHFYPSSGEPYRGNQLDPLLPPSRGQRLSTSASSSRASVSGEGHAISDDEAGEE